MKLINKVNTIYDRFLCEEAVWTAELGWWVGENNVKLGMVGIPILTHDPQKTGRIIAPFCNEKREFPVIRLGIKVLLYLVRLRTLQNGAMIRPVF